MNFGNVLRLVAMSAIAMEFYASFVYNDKALVVSFLAIAIGLLVGAEAYDNRVEIDKMKERL